MNNPAPRKVNRSFNRNSVNLATAKKEQAAAVAAAAEDPSVIVEKKFCNNWWDIDQSIALTKQRAEREKIGICAVGEAWKCSEPEARKAWYGMNKQERQEVLTKYGKRHNIDIPLLMRA